MNTTLKSLRVLAGAGTLVLVTSLSSPAAVSSDVATRPGGNVPAAAIPQKEGSATERGTMDTAKIDTKNQSNKSANGAAYDSLSAQERKPAGGSMTGGSPDNTSTKSPARN